MFCSLVTDSKIFTFEHYSLVVCYLCDTTGRKGLWVLSLPLRLPMLPSTLFHPKPLPTGGTAGAPEPQVSI